MHGAPALPEIDRWREVYMATAYRNNADAGVFLKQWMVEAGLAQEAISYTNSVITYNGQDDAFRRAWGDAWATRTTDSALATQGIEYGIVSDAAELARIAEGWQQWADDPASVFVYVNGEAIGRKAHGS